MSDCGHENIKADVIDQTLGVICMDCGAALGYCWPPQHVSESLWNRSCKNEEEAIPCEQDREDVCAVCGLDMQGGERSGEAEART